MNDLIAWSIESTIVLTVLFLIYFLCFKNNTSIKLRRTLMLGILGVSLLSPLVKVDLSNRWSGHTVIDFDERIISSLAATNRVETTAEFDLATPPQESLKAPIDYRNLVYQIGIICFGLLLIIQLGKLLYIISTGKWTRDKQTLLIEHQLIKAPSSFLFAVLLPKYLNLTPSEKEIIITHEKEHIIQRHSLDLIAVSVIQIIMWYNPVLFWIRSEFKNIHEALADSATLKKVDNKAYLQVLLASAFSTNTISLSHCFGQKKGLLKRIQLIKKQQTTMKRTAISLFAFSLLTISVIGVNVLSAQEVKMNTLTQEDIQSMTPRQLNQYMLNARAKAEGYPKVSSKEEALAIFKRNYKNNNRVMYHNTRELTGTFKKKLSKLQEIYPNKEIVWRYIQNSADTDYSSSYNNSISPLYVGKLTPEDKDEIIEIALANSNKSIRAVYSSNTYPVYHFNLNEVEEELRNSVRSYVNYVLFYEYSNNLDEKIYNERQVDELPEPIGGLEAFERAIALDINIPDSLEPEDLPETIDITAVITGGKDLHSVNLVTKIKGQDKKNDDLYKFYGSIIKEIQQKTRSFYSWKRGIKNGKEVKVRMTISIPTKYMM